MAQSFVIFDAPNASSTAAEGINDLGDVAGSFRDASQNNKGRGFIRAANGNITVFDAPNASSIGTTGINDSGDVAGWFVDTSQNNKRRSFIRAANGNVTVFDAPNASSTGTRGINDSGDVAGYFSDASQNNKGRGFIRAANGNITVFDAPRASFTAAEGINDSGDVAGDFYDNDDSQHRQRGFVRDANGNITVFDAAGNAYFTATSGINDSGDVAGVLCVGCILFRSFIRAANGNITVFDAPNAASVTYTRGINDLGDVAGEFSDASQNYKGRGFIRIADNTPPTTLTSLSPVPNSMGWNHTNVTVNLTSIDNPGGAGVKQIQFNIGNTGWQTVAGNTASVVISAEGTTILSYYATDNAGNQEATRTLTVKIDKTPPAISGMPVLGCRLWPPNHKMIQVATVGATDALSGVVPGSFNVTGTSNEPSDPNNPEIVITPNSSSAYVVQLRAERLGSGTGRVYTLNATASDLAGNTATVTATCTVPHDQGN